MAAPDASGGLTGTILASRYRLIRLVKEGGMGAVYEAEDTKLGRRLAVKILSPQLTRQPEMLRRFFREAKAPSFAQHPNIVEYLDFDQIEGGVAYLVMEYLQGDDLERVLKRRGPLPWAELAPLMRQSCRALAAAHAAGIIHRDIKPSNFILLDRRFADSPPVIKLIDFGIAKFTEESRFHSNTEVTEHIMGSQRFIAPEMYAMVPANPRTDIFALGVTMFRLLTGKYPESDGHYDMVPPSALRPDADIPPEVDELILKAIHVNPYARFADMNELEGALLDHIRRPEPDLEIEPPPVPSLGTTGPSPVVREATSATVALHRRARLGSYVARAAGIVAVLVTGAALLWLAPDPTQPDPAPRVSVPAPPSASVPAPAPVTPAPAPATPAKPIVAISTEPPAPAPAPPESPPPLLEPLDMGVVDRKLASKAGAVSKCGVADGLFRGMHLTVTVRIDRSGAAHTTIENAGNHPYVRCIVQQLQALKFEPSRDGGKRTRRYTI